MIYLDNSATTRQYDEVTDLMSKTARETFGNPSSLHTLGFEANNLLRQARSDIAGLMSRGGEIVFTSGGTESDNMALVSAARKMKRRGRRIVTTAAEHPAVLETCKRLADEGFEVIKAGLDSAGCVKTDEVISAINDDTIIVSVMTVNNETGTIMPVTDISRAIRDHNKKNGTQVIFHTDAVQAFGKLSMQEIDADLISVSGHKFHGPRGTGFLYMKSGLKLPAFITGGGQEGGYRSSTENLPGIAGMALAARMSYENIDDKMKKISSLSDCLKKGLETELKDIHINGSCETGFSAADSNARCPAVLNISFEGTRGEVLLHTLEQDGIFVSTGSACSSHKTGDSHVLQAMGLGHKQIEGAIRFSFSEFNTAEEMDIVIDRVSAAVKRFRRLGSFR